MDNLGEDEKDGGQGGQGHVLIIDNMEEESLSNGSSKGKIKVGSGLSGSRNGKKSNNSDGSDDDKNDKNRLDDRRDSATKA